MTAVLYRVRLAHPKNKPELDIILDVARFHGDGHTRNRRSIIIHNLDGFGLARLERELPDLVLSVSLERE